MALTVQCKEKKPIISWIEEWPWQRPNQMQRLGRQIVQASRRNSDWMVVQPFQDLEIGALAAAIARQAAIQDQFSDGVLWIRLGPHPDLLRILHQLLSQGGAEMTSAMTIQGARQALGTMLRSRAILLILEAVWNEAHLQVFPLTSGCRSRLLLVNTPLQPRCGRVLKLDLPSPDQGIQLCQTSGADPVGVEEKILVQRFAFLVDHRPIFLRMGATLVGQTLPWSTLVARVETPRLQVLSLPVDVSGKDGTCLSPMAALQGLSPAQLVCLELALEHLTSELRLRFASLGVFALDATLTPFMLSILWEVIPEKAAEILQGLSDRGLIQAVHPGTAYRLDAAMAALAIWLIQRSPGAALGGLGLTLLQMHRQLLVAYLRGARQRQWHTLPQDGYLHAHLSWHLQQAGWQHWLHRLLQGSDEWGQSPWHQACRQVGTPYHSDIARAWHLAQMQFASQPAQSLGHQVRYAFLWSWLYGGDRLCHRERTSGRSGASLRAKIPTLAQALTLIAAIPDPRSDSPSGTAGVIPSPQPRETFPVHRGNSQHLVLEEALALISLASHEQRWDALIQLAPYLTSDLTDPLCQLLQNMPVSPPEICELLARLPQVNLAIARQALILVAQTFQEEDRALALIDLLPCLPAAIYPEVLALGQAMASPLARCQVRAALLPTFPQGLPEVLDLAQQIGDRWQRFHILARFLGPTPHSPHLIAQLQAEPLNSPNEAWATWLAVLPYLPEAASHCRDLMHHSSFSPWDCQGQIIQAARVCLHDPVYAHRESFNLILVLLAETCADQDLGTTQGEVTRLIPVARALVQAIEQFPWSSRPFPPCSGRAYLQLLRLFDLAHDHPLDTVRGDLLQSIWQQALTPSQAPLVDLQHLLDYLAQGAPEVFLDRLPMVLSLVHHLGGSLALWEAIAALRSVAGAQAHGES
ncbi:hypothetical protein [Lyngbya confervoides]|uniref:Uncharacterized protein n=1 Tax=Lyngbya confervoides BDU141951 TaxID=1574623 RepID=A0ABD4T7R3_9CYAN|nr:hypothetical protein [Lyngbya confervoides]MCM1984327.1 hypothetical protein [Lyngbya confervoides BDU141951]